MHLQFIGSGDAFGSGGRLNTCFHVIGAETNFLIDCGATSLVGLKKLGIDINAIDLILVTHFHGDHFGGVPFFVLDAQLVAKRTRPLTIAGPLGLQVRYRQAMDVIFPSFPYSPTRFQLELVEMEVGIRQTIGALHLTAFPVIHSEAAGPCVGYRIEAEGRILAYSGDTEWTETLIDIGRDADLFVCECYTRELAVRGHNNLAALTRHLDRIAPKQIVFTHMSTDMLAHLDQIPYPTAIDGLVVDL